MPTTYNGIGTHYYGRKNVLARPGVCPHCNRSVNLVSYDTRLWFVIVFIPVIPLGRKRIIDRCPACSRHYAVELQKWETAKQLDISGALEKFRSDPTPENGIAAHRQLLAYHQANEAVALQNVLAEKFADHAGVQAHLAGALTALGRPAEAAPFFERALALRPDLPEARIGAGLARIRAKNLDEARTLLSFLEKPGASQLYALGPLETLALAYQEAGRHEEALDLFARLLAELPAVAQHAGFRKEVKKSESALKRGDTILPKARFSFRRFFQGSAGASAPPRSVSPRTALIIFGAIAAVVVVVLVVANEYVRRHRELQVVNIFGPALRLEIPGLGPVKPGPGVSTVTLPEGSYVAHVSGPVTDDVSLEIHADYFSRWFGKPAWVLNPGGAAILIEERAVYSANPRPPAYNYLYGRAFQYFPNIDHPFTELPEKITVDAGSGDKVLTALALFEGAPANAFYGLAQNRRLEEAVRLAEWRLRRDPEDTEMLEGYVGTAKSTNDQARVRAFLKAGLTNRPVHIEWHRSYQDLHPARRGDPALFAEYEQMLQADPGNSALLYLCGRICGERARATDFFTRSRQADARNPFPVFALAFDLMAAGNWAAAKPLLDQAVELRPADERFAESWELACLALGKFDEAEKSLRARIGKSPTDWRSVLQLADVFIAQGRRGDAGQVVTNLMQAVPMRSPAAGEVRHLAVDHFLYSLGEFAALEKECRPDPSPAGKAGLLFALIEQGRVDEAGRVYPAQELTGPVVLLALSLAGRVAAPTNTANVWQAPALKALRAIGADGERAAATLEAATVPTDAALDEIALPSELKALLFAHLATTHPEDRTRLGAKARQLNVSRAFPYHLIQRATAPAP